MFEELSSLAEKPPLPYSVLVTGGGFVVPQQSIAPGPLGATYSVDGPMAEVFELRRIGKLLQDTNVFAHTAIDVVPAKDRRAFADLPAGSAPGSLFVPELLRDKVSSELAIPAERMLGVDKGNGV